ncbi:hypothetical protein WJX73_004388 [Symbiochloris irregularis]|uniref:tRNA (guanine(26)-N(2))-dimethyltransferase n=1 Tax=Symbiochloris irregularis TaxID=706552 RepID=A0AAW1PID6_9CHLO
MSSNGDTVAQPATSAEAETARVPPEGYQVLQEGKACILHRGNDVFYNPAQVINRDLSCAVLQHFARERLKELQQGPVKRVRGKNNVPPSTGNYRPPSQEGITVLEGLAATGLRSMRYALEVEGVARVDANDLDGEALAAMQRNLQWTGPEAEAKVHPTKGDARIIMLQNSDNYDAVDLDPYGSPAHFLDAAVQAVAEGGLLMVTATDMAVLCGNNGEACWAKYGSYPLHRSFCHEQALRILLASIESHANRYKRYIVPVLSVSIDFYVRVFVRVYTSPAVVKDSATKLAYVYQSKGCSSFFLQRVGRKAVKGNSVTRVAGSGPAVPQQCEETGSGFLMGGPIWAEPLHDPQWVAAILKSVQEEGASKYPAHAKVASILLTVSEELHDVPLYYSLHDLCRTVHCSPPAADTFRSALVNAGYRVSSAHANPLGIKTDAPPSVVWDIIRGWVAMHPVKAGANADSYAAKLLAKEPQLKPSFARVTAAVSAAKSQRAARFLPNPEANWGPMSKARRVSHVENCIHRA